MNQLSQVGKDGRVKTQIEDLDRTYDGEVIRDKRDGYGIEINRKENTIYDGNWKEDMFHGQGTLFYRLTNCFYKGIWHYNTKKMGTEIFTNGDQYEGEYNSNGKFHGQGILHNVRLQYRYEGEFKEGKRDGMGREFYKNGSYYEGQTFQNYKNGKGKLTCSDGTSYEGDFVRGVPTGFGCHIAYTKEKSYSLKPNIQNETINNNIIEIQEKTENDQLRMQRDEDAEPDEYFYEGEFIGGYKHGIGRYYEPDGSYYYCWWEFDRKTGEILHYDASKHKWKTYKYLNENQLSLEDHYKHPDEMKDKIQIIKLEKTGFPEYQIDAYKAKIDECGVSGDQFEDPFFLPSEESFQLTSDQLKEIPQMDFIRISENELLKKLKNDLFCRPIIPGELYLNSTSDYQLVTCLESLTYFPHLLLKSFSVKYDLDTVCFFTQKLYIKGRWIEIVIDDFIPCFKSNNTPIFSNSIHQEIGWLVVQKVFCKFKKRYFYWSEEKEDKQASQYLTMLTGHPCKIINWPEQNDDQESIQQIRTKILKSLSKYNSQIRIAYAQKSVAQNHQIPENFPFILVDYVKTEDEIIGIPGEFNFLLMKTLNSEYRFRKDTESAMQKNSHIQALIARNSQNSKEKDDKRFFVLGLKDFMQNFSELVILLGFNQLVHNKIYVNQPVIDYINKDHKFFFQFNANLPIQILINVEQYKQPQQTNFYPIRLVMGNIRNLNKKTKQNTYDPNIHKFKEQQYLNQDQLLKEQSKENTVQQINIIQNNISEEEKTQTPLMDIQQKDVQSKEEQLLLIKKPSINLSKDNSTLLKKNTLKKVQFAQEEQLLQKKDEEVKQDIMPEKNLQQKDNSEIKVFKPQQTAAQEMEKKKNLPYNYIFGKGQRQVKDMYKTIQLESGQYILLIQVEINDSQSGIQKDLIDFTFSIFSDSLCRISRIPEPQNFQRNIYQACILAEEKQNGIQGAHQSNHFQKTDLSDREKGSNDLVITQCYLKKEGTFLQFLRNKSSERNQKSWRQKLYFKTTNMQILDQNDPNKVDLHILPSSDALIIIQQIGGKQYNLEGGEGICIIDKIDFQIDDYEDNENQDQK